MGDYSEYRHRGLRSPDGIANRIILTRQYPGNEFLSFLIVEGEDDWNFYKTFVDKHKCQISSAYGKSIAIQVLSILEKDKFPGVLLIVDADFDILEGKFPSNRNMLFTDTHDLETMIIRSPALEKVLGEFGSEEKIGQITRDTGKDMRAILLASSMPIGYLRWVSLREELSLKFEDLDFAQFINRETLTIDLSDFIRVVKNKSQRHDIAGTRLKASMQDVKNDTHDPWQVCCGHDLICILSIGLRKAIGTWNASDVKPDILERSLRLAFEGSYFYKTQLYVSIQQWEKVHEPFVVLVSE